MREPTLNGQEMEEKQEEGGREKEIGSEKKKKTRGRSNQSSELFHVHPPFSFFHLCLHFFQPSSVSVTLFFSFNPLPFSPFFTSFFPPLHLSLPVYTSIHLFSNPSLLKHLLPSLVCCTSFPLCFYFFCVTLPPSPFISCFSLAFFPNTLLSHYLSPSIVVVVDYVIRAEDMSFLSTRFSAQHDYTKPLSTVYRSRVCALA